MKVGLHDRVALVTGAASGIGRATANRLVAEGAAMGLIDCDEAGLVAVADELRAQGAKIETAIADLATASGVTASIGALLDIYGRVDVLVNNAGVFRVRPFDEATDDHWQEAFDLHVMAAVRACRLVLPVMRGQRSGCVLFVVSDLARHPKGIAPHYEASKTSLLSLIAILAAQEGPRGIRVNGVAPGPTDTPMLAPLKAHLARQSNLPEGQAMEAELRRRGQALGGRLVRPDEVAAALGFLAANEAITGAVLNVDGGTPGGLP